MHCLGRPFGGGVAPGAGAGGAAGADLEPVLGAAGQAGDGAARGFASNSHCEPKLSLLRKCLGA